ncbi:hypothetical protein B9Z55_017905 [Caenorhabditis nigoni]|uniref:Uncharacterized protein n=2 Tax=Caenorhabditis nigoni TaxID=1611254 RepID=A0A2G5TBT7_9PELO|nr:hypothetical protein B9Z55_017905 [Caenorhabditis nigoni]
MLGISLRYQCTLFAAIIWSVLVATVTVFENRYNLIYGRGTSWAKFRYPLLAANWISAFAYPLPAFLAFPEQTEALKIVMTTLPPLPDYILKHQIDVYMTDLHYFIIPMIIMTGILATEMAVIGKLMHSATHSVAKKCRMSQKTMALQKAILRDKISKDFLFISFKICSTMNTTSLSYLHTPQFLNTVLDTMTFFEIPIHILGVYCILCKTPDPMKSVKWSMFNLLIWSLILDLGISVLTSPFLLFPTFSGYPLGVLKYIGVPTEIQTYSIVMVYAMVGTAILTLFENRYFLMFARYHAWKNYRIKFLIINYFLASCFFIPAYFAIPEQTEALRKVFEVLPQLPDVILNAPLFVLANDLGLVLLSVLLMTILLVSEIGVLALLLYLNMKKRTRRMATSQYTLNLQKKFLRSIYLQVSTPFLILITPLSYTFFSVVFGFYNQAANNMCTIFFALHGLVSTLTCILTHKTYRKSCFSLLTFNILQKGTTSSIVVPSRLNRAAVPAVTGNTNSKVKTLIYSVNQKIRV